MNRAGHCWRCEAPCTKWCSRCRVAFYCSKECQKQDKWRHEPDCDDAVFKKKCLGCGVEQEEMARCSNCLEAFYCSVECQRKHWPQHKSSCNETVDRTVKLANKIKVLREIKEKMLPGLLVTYYWGNIPAVDLINLSMNEGEEYSNPLALLLCGVGDPRNVLLTMASLPDVYKQQVTFVLNDICPCTLARTALLLYMLYKGEDDVIDAVIRIWYSVCISDKDFALLMTALADLVTTELCSLTEGIMEISADQLNQLKNVWFTWQRLSQRKGPWVAEQRDIVNSSDPRIDNGLKCYLGAIPEEHRISARQFINTGIFASTATNVNDLTHQNLTMTGQPLKMILSENPGFHYCVPADGLPFNGWDYRAVKKICYDDSLPEMYSNYLSQILRKSVEKLRRNHIKFHFILDDFLNIYAFLPADLRYDRITTSNLWDYCPPPVLLKRLKAFLNGVNPHAVMLTETQSWASHADFQHIIEPTCIPDQRDLNALERRALEDTRNPELVLLTGSALIEYLNTTREFNVFLRASLLTSFSHAELVAFKRKNKLPSVKSLVGSLGLELRDFVRNENKVFPFRWALNCRRVTTLRGYERALEWKLPSTGEGSDTAKELERQRTS